MITLRELSELLAHILDRVPPAFSAWVKTVTKSLTKQYDVLHKRVEDAYKEVISTTSIPVPFPVGTTLSAPQCKTIEKAIKKAIQERFAEYPDIEPFLYHKWNGAKYVYPDGKRVGDAKAALRLYLWDTLYPEHNQPFLVDGEEKEL